jgi:hypothetical protein
LIGSMIRDICFGNADRLLGLPMPERAVVAQAVPVQR